MKKIFTLIAALAIFAGNVSAKDITIYMSLTGGTEGTPYFYYWTPGGGAGWPGEAMTGPTSITNPKTGASMTFYSYTLSGLSETATVNCVINMNSAPQTADITGVSSDRYFTWDGTNKGGLTDITTDFTEIPDATINTLTLSGAHNGWGEGDPFEVVTDQKEYKIVLDLTDFASDVSCKVISNGTWLGYNNFDEVIATQTVDGSEITLAEDKGDNHDINILNETSGFATYVITATWAGGKAADKGWKLKIEGKDPRTQPAEASYYIAGSAEILDGNAWAVVNENKMIKQDDGSYKLEKKGKELLAGTDYKFKLVKDGSEWIPNGTDNDAVLTVETDGVYDIVYTMTEPVEGGYSAVATASTGITEVKAAQTVPTVFYNLKGQRVNADTKGILIANGKKFVR